MSRAAYAIAATLPGLSAVRKTRPGAGAELVYQAQRIIEAKGMRDTLAGWAFYRRALRLNRDICAGVVVAADLAFMGDAVHFTALP